MGSTDLLIQWVKEIGMVLNWIDSTRVFAIEWMKGLDEYDLKYIVCGLQRTIKK